MFQCFLENQRKIRFGNFSFVLKFHIYQEVFSKCFLYCFFFKILCFLTLELINSNPIFRIFVLWENYLLSLLIPKLCLWSLDHQVVIFFFVFGFVPSLFCRGDCVWEKSCVLLVLNCNSSVEVPLWKVLCRHSENSSVWRWDVEQWLEPRNYLGVCIWSTTHQLYLFLYLALLYIVHIQMLDIICVCPHLCSTKRAFKSLNS